MTQEEIYEYNKRCAIFIGFEPPVSEGSCLWIHKTLFGGYTASLYSMKFHSDWNWIMKVVEAIEKLGYQFDITGNEVGVNSNIMSMENISTGGTMNSYNRSYYPTIISICEEKYSKKGALVQAINQFLIWYENETNKNK